LEKSDEMLVKEIKDGQLESYDKLMQRHQKNVYRIAFSFASSEQGAMDIYQNIFLMRICLLVVLSAESRHFV